MTHRRYGLTAALLAGLVLGLGAPVARAQSGPLPKQSRPSVVDVDKGLKKNFKRWKKRTRKGARGTRGTFKKLPFHKSKAFKKAKRTGARGATRAGAVRPRAAAVTCTSACRSPTAARALRRA